MATGATPDAFAKPDKHNWREVLGGMLGDDFPRVCSRCLLREDRPGAQDPCDAAVERAAAREIATKEPKAKVCTCRTIALSGWDTVQQVVDPRCPLHTEEPK